MERRPDFIPWIWDPTERNQSLGARPDKVLRYLLLYSPVGMAVLVVVAWTLGDRTTRYLAVVGAVIVVSNAVVYGPRAWRATRDRSTR
jgi:Mg2+/citrate symporter